MKRNYLSGAQKRKKKEESKKVFSTLKLQKNTRDSITKPSCLVNRPWKLRTNVTLDIFTEVLCVSECPMRRHLAKTVTRPKRRNREWVSMWRVWSLLGT
ncbi:hypothetical protein DPEC_G00350380 [Dallia pectoralis]|uniref:Uncharacterized protein n=1 Tax=Dallia pectoralis TaxID=75939 RepID=A0ACC2F233_DALPE|nr:hypothetical protein DPEC_G00350380 [Dallia pectoralis]